MWVLIGRYWLIWPFQIRMPFPAWQPLQQPLRRETEIEIRLAVYWKNPERFTVHE
jgi:hypothetical protein